MPTVVASLGPSHTPARARARHPRDAREPSAVREREVREVRGPRLRSHRWITLWSILGSVGMTALMSALLNHGTVRHDMLLTGGVCALVLDPVIGRITRHYRRRLAAANEILEQRVTERTADLAAANASLREAAAEQASLRDELFARDRLATAGMLAAGVSHEIRSPLTVITMGVGELEDLLPIDTPDDVRAVLADVHAASEQIAVVVRDLSSLARPAGEPVGPVALAPVVATAVRLAGYQLRTGVTFVDGGLTDAPVVGNASRLVQVVLNLLINAARATRAGVANTIVIAAEERADTIALRVTDTGTGMSPETRARLFTPFFTTGAERGGTGLGLTICRTIIERMGGTIDLDSELGRGTTVEVVLRRAPAAS
ncbi:MAG TPA: ATP-binding protein [Kofleriaceae bacterium]|nr:ATP-binding protein [Kofleriaceae bacterium]